MNSTSCVAKYLYTLSREYILCMKWTPQLYQAEPDTMYTCTYLNTVKGCDNNPWWNIILTSQFKGVEVFVSIVRPSWLRKCFRLCRSVEEGSWLLKTENAIFPAVVQHTSMVILHVVMDAWNVCHRRLHAKQTAYMVTLSSLCFFAMLKEDVQIG